jgi:hypothetical protein
MLPQGVKSVQSSHSPLEHHHVAFAFVRVDGLLLSLQKETLVESS